MNRISELPNELKLAVLFEIADMKTLRSFTKALPDFKAVFSENKKRITSTIYFREACQIAQDVPNIQSPKFVKLAILLVCLMIYPIHPTKITWPWVLEYLDESGERMPKGRQISEFKTIIYGLEFLLIPWSKRGIGGGIREHTQGKAWNLFRCVWREIPPDEKSWNMPLEWRELCFLLLARIAFGPPCDPLEPSSGGLLLRLMYGSVFIDPHGKSKIRPHHLTRKLISGIPYIARGSIRDIETTFNLVARLWSCANSYELISQGYGQKFYESLPLLAEETRQLYEVGNPRQEL
ncbi:hypothetical protein RRF57_000998 [Xylaria bambusicola]|uniref:Uncharacterized protein n=1 Tax=Xylaria bambusicola TaxID=326684 RepID=A0AAN7Z185_9PEZI